MKRLNLRKVPFFLAPASLEDLYEIYDQFGETYGEPRPYDVVMKDIKVRQAQLDAQALEDAAAIGLLGGFVG